MDEGVKAIIKEIAREISVNQYERTEKERKEDNRYLNGRIEELRVIVDRITAENKEKEKKIIRNVTIVSTIVPTMVLIMGWIKGILAGWISKPPH